MKSRLYSTTFIVEMHRSAQEYATEIIHVAITIGLGKRDWKEILGTWIDSSRAHITEEQHPFATSFAY